ncbi:MAG TPA: glutamine-hydrolyzing carbamoyl-phosphate synthase small subunit [Candidatus Binataceae bacterium]|nr:glutamine-hydrolyzing carbamoyl-phosphate synthase small subunit [Candidatus Binataceae bacterium]
MQARQEAILALADGRIFRGRGFGAIGETIGEVVFNTAMTGYQEVLTDPSYKGQIVCMTYPQIGNVGINPEDEESDRIHVEGLVVREYLERPSNWRARNTLGEYLERAGIAGIEGIDTRALVRHIRTAGAQQAVISSVNLDAEELVAKAKAAPGLEGRDLVKEVTCTASYDWEFGDWDLHGGFQHHSLEALRDAPLVAAIDYGIKRNILHRLVASGFRVKVMPAFATAAEILALDPDGVFLANGPADPAAVPYARETVCGLIGHKPIFGICLGHQILALALGGKTYKLGFGHHGANHPVMDLQTGRVEITSQNHGFAVDAKSLEGKAELTHRNLNDDTIEGLRGNGMAFFSVQYHPEASPGPHDSSYLFGRFRRLVEAFPRYGTEALERIEGEEPAVRKDHAPHDPASALRK